MVNLNIKKIIKLIKLEKKIVRGFGWLTLLKTSTRILDLVRLAIVARLLSPADIGVFVLATSVLNTFNALFETGISYAAIYMEENLSLYTKTLLAINFGRGICLSLIILFLARFLSNFFGISGLLEIVTLLSLLPLIQGLENPAVLLFQKKLNFKKYFFFQFFPSLSNAIFSILFAFLFHSPKGLALGLLLGTLIQTLFSYFVINPNFRHPIKLQYVKKLFSYSKWISFGGVFAYLTSQVDNFFIGKFFGAYSLGLYDIAFKLSNIAFSEFSDILARALFPYFAQFRKDVKKVKQLFIQSTLFSATFGLVPSILFILAPQFILSLVFGNKWLGAAPILTILSIYGYIRCATNPAGPLFLGIGKPHVLSVMNFLHFVLILFLIFPFSAIWKIQGVAFVMVTAYILIQPYQLYHIFKFLNKRE